MSQFAQNIHALLGSIVSGSIASLSSVPNAGSIENMISLYVTHIINGASGGEIGEEVANRLMGDALGWVVKLRQKSAELQVKEPKFADPTEDGMLITEYVSE